MLGKKKTVVAYLICVWRADKNDRTFLRYLPAASWMHFSEEELHHNRECPEECIVNIFVHIPNLFLLGRHFLYSAVVGYGLV